MTTCPNCDSARVVRRDAALECQSCGSLFDPRTGEEITGDEIPEEEDDA
jgi:hypothetical protein